MSLTDDPSFLFQVEFKGHKLRLMTSHLESCKGHAEERMKQLRVAMRRMTEAPDDVTALFGGDTNLRDPEASGPRYPKVLVGHRVWNVTALCPAPGGQGGSPDRCV